MTKTHYVLLAALLFVGCGSGADTGTKYASRIRVTSWGSKGRGRERFSAPRGIALDGGGNVYTVDRAACIRTFTADGAPLAMWHTPASERGNPQNLVIGPDGSLYVADTHYHRILKYDPGGKLLSQFGSYGTAPGQFIYPTDVAVDAGGAIYVSEYGYSDETGEMGRIQKFDAKGKFLKQWGRFGSGEGEFQKPAGLGFDSEGVLYVLDIATNRVQKFDAEGVFLGQWGEFGHRTPGRLNYPFDLAIDGDDNIYIVEHGNCRVQKFTKDGTFLAAFGGPGRQPGEFKYPWGIAVSPGGEIYVADTDNHRIQRFRMD